MNIFLGCVAGYMGMAAIMALLQLAQGTIRERTRWDLAESVVVGSIFAGFAMALFFGGR